MKNNFTRLTATLMMVLLGWGAWQTAEACDRSSIQMDSLVLESDGTYTIYMTQHIGAGITGSIRGGDNTTSIFAYAWYGSGSLTAIDFTPSVTSDFTNVTNTGSNVGAVFGAQVTIAYFSPGPPYACVNSTAGCGTVHTDTKQLAFNFNEVPDSVRMLGVEGAGNPFLGCAGDSDMRVVFGTLPVVWNSFSGRSEGQQVALEWSTSQEVNSDHYAVMRSQDGENFEKIGVVEAAGNISTLSTYDFIDESPVEGVSFYQVVQYDFDGSSSRTNVVEVSVTMDADLAWTHIGPNPVVDMTRIGFTAPTAGTYVLDVFDLQGKRVRNLEIQAQSGNNTQEIDLSNAPGGMYVLQLSGSAGHLEKKILKL